MRDPPQRRTCQKGRRGPEGEGGGTEMIARGNRARRWEPPLFPSRKVISSWRVGGHAIASYTWKSRGRRSELKANRSSASGRVKDYLSESWCCGRESSARPWSSLPVKKSAHRPRAIGEGPEIKGGRGRPRVSPRIALAHKEAVYQLLLEAVTHCGSRRYNVPTEPVHRHA